jgi:hypothetical protein
MLAARGTTLGASFDGPARAIRCAEAIVAESDRSAVRCRAGLHTGECELHGGELRGVAVDIAAEILSHASPGEVLVSRTVADLVAAARIAFVDRGSHTLATVHDSWQLLATTAGRAPAQVAPARRADPGAGRRSGPGRARPARGLGQRARASQRDQGPAQRSAAPRGPTPRAGPPPRARRAHRHLLHVRPRPEGARQLGRLRSPP